MKARSLSDVTGGRGRTIIILAFWCWDSNDPCKYVVLTKEWETTPCSARGQLWNTQWYFCLTQHLSWLVSVGKLDTGDQELVLRLKSQLSDKERNLEDCEDKIKTQDDEIVKLKEQVCLWTLKQSFSANKNNGVICGLCCSRSFGRKQPKGGSYHWWHNQN